jgi:adenylate cyclase
VLTDTLKSRRRRATLSAVALAVAGVLLSVIPAVLRLDESLGLGLLFTVRGTVTPPADVVVVSISRDSAAAVGQPAQLDRWQRSLHAELLDSLVAAGAKAIAFDLFFDEPRADDAQFAEAIARAGNVVLGEQIVQDPDGTSPAVPGLIETRVLPIEVLGRGALGSAPFALPTIPFAVGQFWTFGPSGDLASLPAVALQASLMTYYDDFCALLTSMRPNLPLPASRATVLSEHDLAATMRDLRAAFVTDPSLAAEMRSALESRPVDAASKGLSALIGLYAGAGGRYLNYYGPPRTIRTIPFDVAARSHANLDLDGKMVFVGGSEPRQSEQQDYFHSIFSQQTGANLSGVEIGATAFANLLEQRSLVPLTMWANLLLVALWGASLGFFVVGASTTRAFVVAVVAGSLFFAWVLWQFDAHAEWWPLLVPLALQLPLAVALAVLLNYAEVLRQRELVQAALGHYVPLDVVRRLSEQSARALPERRLLQGACLCTDVESYMTVAETMGAHELAVLMDDYFNVLSRVVKQHGGFVVDATGDALIAVWAAAGPFAESRLRACRAALGIVGAVDEFNARHSPPLPTRVGVESGELLLGNFGPEQRIGYRAIGDIVNTASRLEGLNKILGTRVLVSAATLAGTSELAVRDLGAFLLRGKSTPLRVQELLDGAESARRPPASAFAAALEEFTAAQWVDAHRDFTALRQAFPEDGPTAFYAALAAGYASEPPRNWSGAVAIAAK